MAVSITDTRSLIDEADSQTGWTNEDDTFTSQPDPVEASACIGVQVSNETIYTFHTHGSTVNMSSGELVYVWMYPQGVMDTTANGGATLIIGDGTDTIGYHVGGSDNAGFRHDIGPINWQCMVIDTANLPAGFEEYQGSEGNLNLGAIEDFGAGFTTLVKSVGGVENCFIDIIKYGNDGLVVGGGTTGDRGTFSEIATEDRDNTNAFGICRELGEGLYGLQGPLTFGTTSGTASTYFSDTNTTVVFEDRGISTDIYYLNVSGNSTGTNSFILGSQISTSTSGSDGCSLICPVGVGAELDASNADVDEVLIYGSSISGFNNGVSFSADATNGPNHEVFDTNFIGCGQIDPGQVIFKNNRIADTTDSTTGAILLDSDSTTDWSNLTFTSGGTGHAIYITAAGTYTFTNFFFSGYSTTSLGTNSTPSSGSTDAMVYNNSGGAVTINISGGDNVSVRNGASATTTVNANQSLNITVQDTATSAIQSAVVAVYDSSDDSELENDETDVNGEIPTVSVANGTDIYIRVRKSTTGTRYYPVETVATMDGDLSLTITMTEDTTAS